MQKKYRAQWLSTLCLLVAMNAGCSANSQGVDSAVDRDSQVNSEAATRDSGSDPTSDSGSAPPPSADASADASFDCGICDDGDSATTDACENGLCTHRLCADHAACDDGDWRTAERCNFDASSNRFRCAYRVQGAECIDDFSCFDDEACTDDFCGAGAECRHTWRSGCSHNWYPRPEEVGPICEPTRSVGGMCPQRAGTVVSCRRGEGVCDDSLRCVGNFGNGTFLFNEETVRPGCDNGVCPPEPPSGPCTPGPTYCDYSLDPNRPHPGGIHCRCNEWSGGQWECFDNEPCPRTPPENGSTYSPRTPFSRNPQCVYGDYSCFVRNGTWSCRTTMPTDCPADAPASGSACRIPGDRCRYLGPVRASDPVTTYRGECSCNGGTWSCEPNASADCPPSPGGFTCTPSAGTASCWYPSSESSSLEPGSTWNHCQCGGPPGTTQLWQCNVTAHY